MEPEITKKYSNGEVTIVWQPGMCIHSTVCWKQATGLPAVFNPREKPWIRPQGATTDEIITQVDKCPSGALSYFRNDAPAGNEVVLQETTVEVITNGPLMVYGNILLKDKDGNETRKNKVTAFCRCGHSANKPFCDGSHVKASFKG